MAEKEYIERGALMNAMSTLSIRITPIEENRDMFYHDSGWNGASMSARLAAKNAPAADVVEVVRCKDCKHFWYNEYYNLHLCGNCSTPFYQGEYSIVTEPNDFCSYGERKAE